jgi:tRNA pseudouridine(55) synthase
MDMDCWLSTKRRIDFARRSRRARRILKERRIGHTGTLDPFATGVLLILVGRATRLAQFLSGADKEYDAIIRLGYATDTGDRTGTRFLDPHVPRPNSLQWLD